MARKSTAQKVADKADQPLEETQEPAAENTEVVETSETEELEAAAGTENVQVAAEKVTVRLPETSNELPAEEKLEVHATSSKPEDRQIVVADRRVTTNEDAAEEVVVRRSDVPTGKAKPVRIVTVRAHPEIDQDVVGKKSNVEEGVFVGEQLSLEQVNRFSQKQERIARGEEPLTRAELKRLTRRRGRSLR